MLTRRWRSERRRALHERMRVPGPSLAAPTYKTWLPKGKGMFVRALSHTGTPEQMIARAQWAGVSWVAVQALWQHPDTDKFYNEDLSTYAKALRKAGIDVWVWGFAELAKDRRASFAQIMGHAAGQGLASGILIDAEDPWNDGSDADAIDLVQRLRAAAPGRKIGLTSYGHPQSFPDFPWHGFASTCDLAIPQVYHGHEHFGPDYQKTSMLSYADLGFPALVPGLAAWDLTVAQMLEIYARTPKPIGSAIWWDWYNADVHGTWPAIRNAGAFAEAIAGVW